MSLYLPQIPISHSAPGENRLTDAFLIAATINSQGCIDLVSVRNGKPEHGVRVEVSLGPSGDFVQRCYSTALAGNGAGTVRVGTYKKEPLDMAYLAECLSHALGSLTPALFRLAGTAPRGTARLQSPGPPDDRKRLRLLHEAFNLYLLAYEERLI